YWTGITALANPYTFDVDDDYTIGAVFYSESGGSYTLTPSSASNGDIYITVGNGLETEFTLPIMVSADTEVTIRAVGAFGYEFSYWIGISALDNPYTFDVDDDYTIGAVFYSESVDFYTLDPSPVSNGNIYITVGDGLETEFTQSVTVQTGTEVEIRAVGTSGYVFSYWTGISALDNPYTFEVNKGYTIGAVFYSESGSSYTLTPSSVSNGDVYIKVGNGLETEFTQSVTVPAATAVAIRAEGDSGYAFSYWTGISALANPHTFEVNGDYTIGAVFYSESGDFHTLTPSSISNGNIYIIIGNGLETEFTQSVTVAADTDIALLASGVSGYAFSYWTGIRTLENPYTFDVDDDYTIGAVFYRESGSSYTLTPSSVSNGDIYIKVGNGLETEFTQSVTVPAATAVTIRAEGDSGYAFSYWTGIRTLENPYTFEVHSDYTIGVVFYSENGDFNTLTPSPVSNGNIYVTVGSGLETEFTQSVTVSEDTDVTIRALAASGYTFSHWTGISAPDNPYTFGVDDDYTIGAVFSVSDTSNPRPGNSTGSAEIQDNSGGGGFSGGPSDDPSGDPSGSGPELSAILALKAVDRSNPSKTIDATFEILDEKGNVRIYSTSSELSEEITLKPGIYRLSEVKAPDGYIPLGSPIEIIVNADATIQRIDGLTQDSEREGVYELVIKYSSESKNFSVLMYIILILMILAALLFIYRRSSKRRANQ
ncbi:MAG: prealbumin-like fold domain-containing protein, partial [Methanimicrococcus sp.]|nr:prealbumin-like fold domain-containing protein [Methanimicrococcus sp.]